MQRGWKAAAMIAALGVGGVASAHEFTCEKRVQVLGVEQGPQGEEAPVVTKFPATLRFRYKLKNVHPAGESVANRVEDPLLAPFGFHSPFPTPMALGVGQHRESFFELKLDSLEACQSLAGSDGLADLHFDSTMQVAWDLGLTQCGARISCCEPFVDCELECPPHDPWCVDPRPGAPGPSRNAGFFKVHEQALQGCVAQGSLELGVARVESLEQALGLLWASPGLYRDGEARSEADAQRFVLAREALVASCNERLFGTDAERGRTLDEALRVLRDAGEGTESLAARLKRHNESGTREPLPQGFDAGRATPAHAASLAADPTTPGPR